MDVINIDTNKIFFSEHTPDTEYESLPWGELPYPKG